MTSSFRLTLLWVVVAAIAFAVQLNWMSATYSPDGWVPVGNDAFYHARRIIDTAADPAAFYEFDPKIHAPEGSLVVWPWGYDFGMAMLLRAGEAMGFARDPMQFLAYIPPFAVLVSIGLVIGIAVALELSMTATVMLALCVALSPLTQGMHSIGSIDHHFAEYMVVLAFMASALWWLRNPAHARAAVCTAVVLGTGPAVHNGLFVLQALLVAVLGILWLRGDTLPRRSAVAFSLALIASSIVILLPSLPFRLGMFEYYLLSWFHLYVACCTALAVTMFAWLPRRPSTVAALVLVGALLCLPLVGDIRNLNAFVSTDADALKNIMEARSLFSHLEERGVQGISRIYSGLIFLVPVVWLGCLVALFRSTDRRTTFVCVHALLTLPLMVAQFRFQYFGSMAMYLPLLMFVDRTPPAGRRRMWLTVLSVILALAYYPAVRDGLAGGMRLGNDIYYPMTRLMMPTLAKECRDDPGIVLARGNEGHQIRYHTDCSVIANNFLLTDQHFRAVQRVNALFSMSPQELLQSGFPVKYIFVRARGVILIRADGSVGIVPPEDAALVSDPLSDALLWGDPAAVPPELRLISEVKVPGGAYQYARLWKVDKTSRPRQPDTHGTSIVDRPDHDFAVLIPRDAH